MRLEISAIEAINYGHGTLFLGLRWSKEIQYFLRFQNGIRAYFQIIGRVFFSELNRLKCESDQLLPR
jgi:hypothetical protein